MRAAFITGDVLGAAPDAGAALRRLDESGLHPVVLIPRPAADGERLDGLGYPVVACGAGDADCWGDPPELLLEAAAIAGVAVGEAFLVCGEAEDVDRAVAAGCRPVLVLAHRALEDIYGPGEPAHKEVAAAVDLATATRYMEDEAALERSLGPFAYAPHPVLDEVPRAPLFVKGDLAKLFALVTVAGVAVALGIAYLLQELYQSVRLPAISYYLTLQFIPQTLRGLLFIFIGAILGAMVTRLIAGMRARRGYSR